MVTKRGKTPTKTVKSLKAKGLTAAQAKKVKGGGTGLVENPTLNFKPGSLNFKKAVITVYEP